MERYADKMIKLQQQKADARCTYMMLQRQGVQLSGMLWSVGLKQIAEFAGLKGEWKMKQKEWKDARARYERSFYRVFYYTP